MDNVFWIMVNWWLGRLGDYNELIRDDWSWGLIINNGGFGSQKPKGVRKKHAKWKSLNETGIWMGIWHMQMVDNSIVMIDFHRATMTYWVHGFISFISWDMGPYDHGFLYILLWLELRPRCNNYIVIQWSICLLNHNRSRFDGCLVIIARVSAKGSADTLRPLCKWNVGPPTRAQW